jgi:hypothetical protein
MNTISMNAFVKYQTSGQIIAMAEISNINDLIVIHNNNFIFRNKHILLVLSLVLINFIFQEIKMFINVTTIIKVFISPISLTTFWKYDHKILCKACRLSYYYTVYVHYILAIVFFVQNRIEWNGEFLVLV